MNGDTTTRGDIVETSSGPVRGLVDTDTGRRRFLGIPYAEPPLGPLRFRPPEPVKRWSTVRDALTFGPPSAQYFDPQEALIEELDPSLPPGARPGWVGSEDSLTLNVWAPREGTTGRPVIVFLHGGANWLESSRLGVYHGDALAARGDIVFCSLNYRLGLFGFVDLGELLGEQYGGSHANGLRDQLLALQWIRANVSAFGGDPSNITLVGESAGSMDISWLLAAGELHGLVRRVVLMSGVAGVRGFGRGAGDDAYSRSAGRRDARAVLSALGITRAADLLGAATDELMTRLAQAVPQHDMLFFWDSVFYPRADQRWLDATPFDYVRTGRAAGLDVIVGCTAYEMGLWLLWDPQLNTRDSRWAASRLTAMTDSSRDALAAFYESRDCHLPEEPRAPHVLGDAMFAMPTQQIADDHANSGGRTWMYVFGWEVPGSPLRATHAADVLFFLGTWDSPGGHALLGAPRTAEDAAQRAALSGEMQDSLLSFARGAEPGGWPQYDTDARRVAIFGTPTTIVADPFGPRRRWWQQHVYEPELAPARRRERLPRATP